MNKIDAIKRIREDTGANLDVAKRLAEDIAERADWVMRPPAAVAPPRGCICPPTSEATCQRWDCGRKFVLPPGNRCGA